jgi:hypothetical protein
MNYAAKMWSGGMIYKFMKFDTSSQLKLRFCLSNFKSSDVGITDGRNLQITPLWYVQAPYTYKHTDSKPTFIFFK